nr:acyl-CoA thioesterase II [Parahaliea mediterranea]
MAELIELLEVERIDKYLFIGDSPRFPQRVFGGQVLAQALYAASQTVEASRPAHSMHAYFLRPGNPDKRIVYEVDPIRDGRSFTTRRVVAKQDGAAIFNAAISFHTLEDGLEHQLTPPAVTPPEELESDAQYWGRRSAERPDEEPNAFLLNPLDRWPVKRRNYDAPEPQEPVHHCWFRARGEVGDDPVRHQILLAYMSDFALLATAMLPHPYSDHTPGMQVASLDHAIWFHRPARTDDHLLYSMDSPTAHGSRGLSRGTFFTREGELVASTAQESLMRTPR